MLFAWVMGLCMTDLNLFCILKIPHNKPVYFPTKGNASLTTYFMYMYLDKG